MTYFMFGKGRLAVFCGTLAIFAAVGGVLAETYAPYNWPPQAPAAQRANTGTRVADVISPTENPHRLTSPVEGIAALERVKAEMPHVATQAAYQAPAAPAAAPPTYVTPAMHQEPTRMPAAVRETSHSAPAPAAANQPGEIVSKINIPTAGDGLIAFQEILTTATGRVQQLTVIDPKQRSICVYHIDMNTGQIELRSARDIQWDLQMNHLNSKKPLPHEVRGILQGARN